MAEASKHLDKLSQRLFPGAGDRAAFIAALESPPAFAPTILWTQPKPEDFDLPTLPPLDWQPGFVDRLAGTGRPGQHPLHQAGFFYCLDLSSVFAISVVQAIQVPIGVAIDLCAAPGGKSLFTWGACQPQQLLCNEVVRKRVKILISNLKRCGVTEAIALNLDPSVLAAAIPHSASLVIVDAPCSGQSLLAKGQAVPGCFHPVTLNRNANRQKRILANGAQLVQSQGYLAYMTCTYAPEENEQVCDWFLKKFPQFAPVPVPALQAHQSPLTVQPCYRLWPQSGLGAGAFAMLFQCQAETPMHGLDPAFLAQHGMTIYPHHPKLEDIS